jgi:hypothetical protein
MSASTTEIIQQLQQFQAQDHFAADGELYTGVQDATLKQSLNEKVAQAAQRFISLYQHSQPTKDELLQTLSNGIYQIDPDTLDTEDREQVAFTFEQFLDITGLESSNNILNTWLYGEEVGEMLQDEISDINND